MADSDKNTAMEAHHLARLIELRDHCFNGNAAAFGRALGVADTYAVRMFWDIGAAGRKGVGLRMQARIRDAFKLPAGWFDLPLGSALPPRESGLAVNDSARLNYSIGSDNEEDILLRAFRLAVPEVRHMWLAHARDILARHDTPLPLAGNSNSQPGRA